MAVSIQTLPEEILEKIFSYLSPYKEYDIVALVCKQWRRIIAGVAVQFQKNFESSFISGNLQWTEVTIECSKAENLLRNHNGTKMGPMSNIPFMSPRLYHSMCYNDFSRSVYVFGGKAVGSQYSGFNDLWRLDMHSRKWERPNISGDFPPPKFGCSLESYKNFLVLYGGFSMPHTNSLGLYRPHHLNNEVHVYDTATNKWQLKPTMQADSAPGFYMHGTCVVTDQSGDGDNCMLLFGGIREQGGTDSDEIWCLDLSKFSWYKPAVIGSNPPARHMHTQCAFKHDLTFSSAVLIVGGTTKRAQILSDAWILLRSGYKEWTATRLNILPAPDNFFPAISVFGRPAVRVGPSLIFFGTSVTEKVPTKRKAIKRIYPYERDNSPGPPLIRSNSNNWNHIKHHLNPICVYVLDISEALLSSSLAWRTSYTKGGEKIATSMLGPNKLNFHVATVARGEVVVHGDFPQTTPQMIERTIQPSQNFMRGPIGKWTPLYFLSEDK